MRPLRCGTHRRPDLDCKYLLQRHDLFQFPVNCFPDNPVGALAQLLDNLVFLKDVCLYFLHHHNKVLFKQSQQYHPLVTNSLWAYYSFWAYFAFLFSYSITFNISCWAYFIASNVLPCFGFSSLSLVLPLSNTEPKLVSPFTCVVLGTILRPAKVYIFPVMC